MMTENTQGCTCSVRRVSLSTVQGFTLLYVGDLLKKNGQTHMYTFTVFTVIVIQISVLQHCIAQRTKRKTASAIVRPWLAIFSTSVLLISSGTCGCPWPFLPLPVVPPYPSTIQPYSSSSRQLTLFISQFSIVRNCNTVLCLSIEGSWDAPLSYFTVENCKTSPSLEKAKIHLRAAHQLRHICFKKSNRAIQKQADIY